MNTVNYIFKKIVSITPTIKITIEKWKWNEEFSIFVSTLGRLKSASGIIIKPKMGDHYLKICNYQGKWIGVHRLVMMTFNPIPNMDELTVDHLDHNTRNNAISNLEWISEEENKQRADADLINITSSTPISKVYCKECNKVFTLHEAADYLLHNEPSIQCNNPPTFALLCDKIWKAARNPNNNHKYANHTWTIYDEA